MGGREPAWAGGAGATHIGFITAGFEDEFLWPVLPALHRRVGGSKARGPEGQPGFAVLFLQNAWGQRSPPAPQRSSWAPCLALAHPVVRGQPPEGHGQGRDSRRQTVIQRHCGKGEHYPCGEEEEQGPEAPKAGLVGKAPQCLRWAVTETGSE